MAINDHGDFAPTEIFQPNGGRMPVAKNHGGGEAQVLPIRFTGSGSEYFRIWVVNLLLTLVTLTLYLPFARARRMAYFQNNTFVGDDPLGFHADPWRMFRGYLVVLALGLAYWGVTQFLPEFDWIALLLFMALWPLLWRASLQFRLRNTSWRGVRLSFLGDAKGAYVVMLPFFLPFLVLALLVPAESQDVELDLEQAKLVGIFVGLGFLAFAALMPWLWKGLKGYQHGGYAFTQERTDFTATTGQFYKLGLKLAGLVLLMTVGLGVVAATGAAVFAGLGLDAVLEMFAGKPTGMIVVVIGVMVVLSYVTIPLVVGAYLGSRMQNLLWSNTQSQRLRLHSDLRMGPLMGVTFVNWLLIAMTLGLYWPFAKVRLARIKLEAMSVEVDGQVNDWIAQTSPDDGGALGDAAGDFFGMDVGL